MKPVAVPISDVGTPISDKVVGCSSNSRAVGTSYVMSIGTGTEACQED